MHTFLSLDPGVTTGYCFGSFVEGNRVYICPGQKKLSLSDMKDVLDTTISLGSYGRRAREQHCHIIYEDFKYRNAVRPGLELFPVKLIGIIEYMREEYNTWARFYKQDPGQVATFYNDEKLKRLGVYVKGKEHARWATRHLLHWLGFQAGSGIVDRRTVQLELAEPEWLFGAYYDHHEDPFK